MNFTDAEFRLAVSWLLYLFSWFVTLIVVGVVIFLSMLTLGNYLNLRDKAMRRKIREQSEESSGPAFPLTTEDKPLPWHEEWSRRFRRN